MYGLIVKQPYASMIIDESKKWELRSTPPPSSKLNKELYLLSSSYVFGKIRIKNFWVADKKELERHKTKHRSETIFLDINHCSFVWEIKVTKKLSKPKPYCHPTGARVWVKNVRFNLPASITDFC